MSLETTIKNAPAEFMEFMQEYKAYQDDRVGASVQFSAEGAPIVQGGAYGGFADSPSTFLRLASIGEELPEWWSVARDIFLRKTLHHAPFISGVVYGETVRVKHHPYKVMNDEGALTNDYADLFRTANFGKGISDLFARVAIDYLTQDNGCFIELIGNSKNDRLVQNSRYNMKVAGELQGDVQRINSLDSGQCWRTYDPEFPVLYQNPYPVDGKPYYVLLHWSRVWAASQFTQNIELGRGLGYCALARSYEMLRLIRDMTTYKHEKLSGADPDLTFIQGVSDRMLDRLRFEADQQLDGRGLLRWKGKLLAPVPGGTNAPPVHKIDIPIKSTPDGFDYEKELNLAVYVVSAEFGIDAREYWVATQTGATKADAELQDLKAINKGRSDTLRTLENFFSQRIMPDGVHFEFDLQDDMVDQRRAENRRMRAETRQIQVLTGELTVEEARIMAANEGDIEDDFLKNPLAPDMPLEPTVTDVQPGAQPYDDPNIPEQNAENEYIAEQTDEVLEAKGAKNERGRFLSNARRLINLARADRITQGDFLASFESLITTSFTAAYLAGIADGGAPGVTLQSLSDNERMELISIIGAQRDYIYGLAQNAFNSDMTRVQANNHANMWTSKGFDQAYNAGLIAGTVNGNLKWVLGATEKHCKDCGRYDGRVYRAYTWQKWGIAPQSDVLECKGYHCKCSLVPTFEKPTKGRPPAPMYGGGA